MTSYMRSSRRSVVTSCQPEVWRLVSNSGLTYCRPCATLGTRNPRLEARHPTPFQVRRLAHRSCLIYVANHACSRRKTLHSGSQPEFEFRQFPCECIPAQPTAEATSGPHFRVIQFTSDGIDKSKTQSSLTSFMKGHSGSSQPSPAYPEGCRGTVYVSVSRNTDHSFLEGQTIHVVIHH